MSAIVITSGKGGVGKTTITANLGAALAMFGKRVVLIDVDMGLRNLDIVLGHENRILYTWMDLVKGVCRLKQALIKDMRCEGLYLLPAPQVNDKYEIKPESMVELCNELNKDFDFILLDSPAGIGQGFKNAIAGADYALVVTTPEISAIRDADRVIGLLEAKEIRHYDLIINKINPSIVNKGDMMSVEDIIGILDIRLLGVIPDEFMVLVSTNEGKPLVMYNKRTLASKSYIEIAMRLMGETIPIDTFCKNEKIFCKLKRLVRGCF